MKNKIKIVTILTLFLTYSCSNSVLSEHNTKSESSLVNTDNKETLVNCHELIETFKVDAKNVQSHIDTTRSIRPILDLLNTKIADTILVKCNFCKGNLTILKESYDLNLDCINNEIEKRVFFSAYIRLGKNCEVLRVLLRSETQNKIKYFFVKNDSVEKAFIALDRGEYKDGMEMADGYSLLDYYAEKKKCNSKEDFKDPKMGVEIWY
ncbi:MAG: hypothetical protein JSU07_09680 [Bacteroidetes bacterium]|nr:hypothetical protein [Bacteroidota bacterium]